MRRIDLRMYKERIGIESNITTSILNRIDIVCRIVVYNKIRFIREANHRYMVEKELFHRLDKHLWGEFY